MKLITTWQLFAGAVFAALSIANVAECGDRFDFFESKIRPVLVQRCYPCHNSIDEQLGGLALDYKGAIEAGGDSGPAIVAGNSEASLLMRVIRHEGDVKMPLDSPRLTDAIIRDFEAWIEMGAPDPRLTKPTNADRKSETDWLHLRNQRANWWSFQPLRQHPVPTVDNTEWNTTAIDRFVYERLQEERLAPQPLAKPEVLVRRLHLILTGLLPAPDLVKRFAENPSSQAYEQLVDRLLASNEFGERWARHWMDWYRYAETHGSEGDPPIPFASQYRDYLIRALCADVPYHQLLREHLAGDLLDSPRINEDLDINESAIGPAHLRMVPHGFGVTDAYDEQITFTDNQIDVISKAMLGLTVSCARCHNHKFDPISQKDFYRLYGVMVSCRPSTVLIDSADKLNTNRTEISTLKSELRATLAEYWLDEATGMAIRLAESPIFRIAREGPLKAERPAGFEELQGDERRQAEENFQAEQSKLDRIAAIRETTHPLGAWHSLSEASDSEYPSIVDLQLRELNEIRLANAAAKTNAEYYLDLRDPDTFDQWNVSGNSSVAEISPAGSFVVDTEGDQAIAGIYPRGIYSHLVSDKHAAVLVSHNFIASGSQTMARIVGSGSQIRVPVRNYPLVHGGLHPSSRIDHGKFQWRVATKKWKYWQDESVHYELRTAQECIPRPGKRDRSWFGITEVIAGDDLPLREEGASLLALIDKPQKIASRADLAAAYVRALKRSLLHWRDGEMTDQQAEFLNAFVELGLLTNQVDRMPLELQTLVAKYRKLEKAIPIPTRAPGVIESQPVDQPLLVRGEYKQESAAVSRKFLEVFPSRPYSKTSSGRLELANDIVGPANTLKSRLLINRLWAYVFGRGLVASTDNFGLLGDQPTHPELLDFLALDFEENGWSIKRALRHMVTSRTFKSNSQAAEPSLTHDAQNRYLSFFTPRRLDAEAIHDSINQLAARTPRAVYLPVIRNRLNPFLDAFNRPTPITTVSFRVNTNVPAQSLATMNSERADEAAHDWFDRVASNSELDTPTKRINAMFEQAYSRLPTAAELALCSSYLGESPNNESYVRLAHALLNTKEFIYVY